MIVTTERVDEILRQIRERGDGSGTAGLHETEAQALDLYLRGCSIRMIASALDMSPGAAYGHIRRAQRKVASYAQDTARDGGEDRGWIEHAVRGDIQERVVVEMVRTEDGKEREEYAVLDHWRPATLGRSGRG